MKSSIGMEEYFLVRAFGEEEPVRVSRKDLVHIIEARVEEIFSLVLQEIKRSGYDGLLPAGMVLTGGASALPGIRDLASQVLGVPVQIAKPQNLIGMVDKLGSPAFSTSVGLLKWATLMSEFAQDTPPRRTSVKSIQEMDWHGIRNWLRRLLP